MATPTTFTMTYIERKPNSDKYRVIGMGVTVEFLACLIDGPEWTVERICQDYNLTPAEVHAAWAFYYDHKDEIDQRITQESQLTLDEERTRNEQRARMIARHQARVKNQDGSPE
jgi:uncharacterized protein (DUF433 family)